MRNVFLDESGVHVQDGVSCIALVYVESANVLGLENKIVAIEKMMGIYPFHWSRTNWRVRERFLQEICREDFSVKIAIMRNPFSEEHYERAIKQLVDEKDNDVLVQKLYKKLQRKVTVTIFD